MKQYYSWSIRKLLFSFIIATVGCVIPSYAFDESVYANVGESFSVHTTYKSGTYSILWQFDGSILEPANSIGANTNSVTFRVKRTTSLGQTAIQATTYYMESGRNRSHTDFWTVYLDGDDPEDVKVSEITLSKTSAVVAMNVQSHSDESWLIATIYPSDATNQDVKWTSSDPTICDVETNDVLPLEVGCFPKKCGTVTITCMAVDGGGAMATCEVSVVDGELHWITAKTIEGIEMKFKVEDATTGTCEVDAGCIAKSSTGKVTIPEIVEGTHIGEPELGVEKLKVSRIGDMAFDGRNGITEIIIPNSVNSIGNLAFAGSGLKKVTISENVTSIGESVFQNCNSLNSVNILGNVTSIEKFMFRECVELTDVSIPESVECIDDGAFLGCNKLRNLLLPSNLKSIGMDAFYGCVDLQDIVIPNNVTSIGYGAFNLCSGLKSVSMGNSVTSIGEKAFEECRELTMVNIPKSVTSIGDKAFWYCYSLMQIRSELENPMPVSISTFNTLNTGYNTILYVPVGCKEVYKTTEGWNIFERIIEGEVSNNKVCDINTTIFPDTNFRNYLLQQNYGKDGLLMELEQQSVAGISVNSLGISSLKGIEYFTALTGLNCYANDLTELDLSHNTQLTTIRLGKNRLRSLDLSNNTALRYVNIFCNNIRDKQMDDLINSLPTNTTGEKCRFLVYDTSEVTEQNICTSLQVDAAKAKGWTVEYYDGEKWTEYEGSNPTEGIESLISNANTDYSAYSLSGQRLSAPKKGINIVGGRKVIIK